MRISYLDDGLVGLVDAASGNRSEGVGMLNLLGATATDSRSETGISIRAIGAVAGITGGADELLGGLDAIKRHRLDGRHITGAG